MRLFILGALLSIDLAISEGDKLKATMQLSKGFLLRSEFIAMLLVRNSSSTLGKVSKKVKAWSATHLAYRRLTSHSHIQKKRLKICLYILQFFLKLNGRNLRNSQTRQNLQRSTAPGGSNIYNHKGSCTCVRNKSFYGNPFRNLMELVKRNFRAFSPRSGLDFFSAT